MASVTIIVEKQNKKYGYILRFKKDKLKYLKDIFEGYKIIYLKIKIGRNQKEFICLKK